MPRRVKKQETAESATLEACREVEINVDSKVAQETAAAAATASAYATSQLSGASGMADSPARKSTTTSKVLKSTKLRKVRKVHESDTVQRTPVHSEVCDADEACKLVESGSQTKRKQPSGQDDHKLGKVQKTGKAETGKSTEGAGGEAVRQVGHGLNLAASVHEFLYVAPSIVPDAGLGLFTRKPLNRGARLGHFCGDLLERYPQPQELVRRNGGAYFMGLTRRPPWIPKARWAELAKPVLVDGTSIHCFANCARGDRRLWNCGVTDSGEFVAERHIGADKELFIWYGTQYWEGI